ncbi:hypothetical protein [Tepidiforma sp.]|jgi:hypothetical protein|uniref:hypothetical protein n=1 Tax=Tepidiforma sp. TaxID=2682230 RepID=UPI00262C9B4B|nr:hypothetical protein [Tepidiforma sp.]MCX7617724.1 hypothetical protein [Tepidiforma sp.]
MPGSASSRAAARRALDRLRALRPDPEAARAFARELLTVPADPETLLAAVELLAAAPAPADLAPLRAAFAWLAAAPKRRDPGTLLRARILDAIAPVATGEDLDLARAALSTVERTVNGSGEPLRAAALRLLARLDFEAAAAQAAITLAAGDARPMSGEPALTAIRVLAAAGRSEALVITALATPFPAPLRAEAVRGLVALEAAAFDAFTRAALPGFVAEPELALALADLLFAHPSGEQAAGALTQLLAAARGIELYASLAASIVAARSEWALVCFADALEAETGPAKLAAAREALSLAPPVPAAARAAAIIERRLGPSA